jgi:hypothetical protein
MRVKQGAARATPSPTINPDLQFLQAPSSKEQISKQYVAVQDTAADALTTVADATSNETKLVKAVESTLSNFTDNEKKLLRQLANQTRGQKPDRIQALVTKIVNPISNPAKYQQAIAYLATTSDDGVHSAFSDVKNKDLRYLASR